MLILAISKSKALLNKIVTLLKQKLQLNFYRCISNFLQKEVESNFFIFYKREKNFIVDAFISFRQFLKI